MKNKNTIILICSIAAVLLSVSCLAGSIYYYTKARATLKEYRLLRKKDLRRKAEGSREQTSAGTQRREYPYETTQADPYETALGQERQITKEDQKKEDETEGRSKLMVAIDPGHQSEKIDMSGKEPNAPGSGTMKRKATGGATGDYSGVPEYKLNLDISLMMKERLEEMGYQVILTREDNDTAISNKERAELANKSGADISVRIHANSDDNHSVSGALALIGSAGNAYVGKLYPESHRLADEILKAYCKETGMKNRGISENDTMTGINWSKIPVMILEMGFMSNKNDDLAMQNKDYQEKMADGIVKGIDHYFGYK